MSRAARLHLFSSALSRDVRLGTRNRPWPLLEGITEPDVTRKDCMSGNGGRLVSVVLLAKEGGKGRLTRNGDVTADRHSEPQGGPRAYLRKSMIFSGDSLPVVEALP